MAKARRTFTPEFKIQAVQLITEQGKSLAEAARDLDLGESMLRSWKQTLNTQSKAPPVEWLGLAAEYTLIDLDPAPGDPLPVQAVHACELDWA